MRRILPGGAVLGDINRVGDDLAVACRPLSAVIVPTIPGKPVTIEHGKSWSKITLQRQPAVKGSHVPMPNYRQYDIHSCGFIAALTVVRHFYPRLTAMDVLKAVRPGEWGVSGSGMKRALRELGIKVSHRYDLTLEELHDLAEQGTPVMLSVWPKYWVCDHWTVVRGFSKNGNAIWLSNHKRESVKDFKREWYKRGEGFVCTTGTN